MARPNVRIGLHYTDVMDEYGLEVGAETHDRIRKRLRPEDINCRYNAKDLMVEEDVLGDQRQVQTDNNDMGSVY